MKKLLPLLAAFLLAGCATGTKTVLVENQITDPKVIALQSARTPWAVEIETRLKQKGFKILRWTSQKQVTEQVSENRAERYQEASARYILVLDGYAPLDKMRRCFGGGYNFQYLTAELVDVVKNETIVSVSGSGYSENCPPASGTIFGDIISAVEGAWK